MRILHISYKLICDQDETNQQTIRKERITVLYEDGWDPSQFSEYFLIDRKEIEHDSIICGIALLEKVY